MCVAHFYMDPEHDGDQVIEALRDVAWTSPYAHLERPVLVVAEEQPWVSHYRLKAYPIEGRDQFRFLTDLTLRGKEQLRRLGVHPCSARVVGSRHGQGPMPPAVGA